MTQARDISVLFVTRFSFLGKGGWRNAESATPETLYEPSRIARRLEIFEHVTLPSLRDQSDPDFAHVILSGDAMPGDQKKALKTLVGDVLGERAVVTFRKPGQTGRIIRRWIKGAYDFETPLAQAVLDDDDAVATDFVEILRQEAARALAVNYDGDAHMYLSFPRGISLVLKNDGIRLHHRNVYYTNQGLALVAPAGTNEGLFLQPHRRVGWTNEARMIQTLRPMYLRTHHGTNDSRAITSGKQLAEDEAPQFAPLFPCLGDLDLLRGLAA
ncbi:MAG: glycosyltransferase [Pseudomonadota bacterium]